MDPFIRPGLRDQIHRGNNPSGGGFFHNGEIVRDERLDGAGQQVTRPGGDALSIWFIIAMDHAVEFRQRICIFRCGTAQDQAIAQITQNCLSLGEHKRSCPVGRLPGIGPVVPAQDNRRY